MLLFPFILQVLMVQPLTAFRRGEGPTNTHHHSPPVNGQLPLGVAHSHKGGHSTDDNTIQRSPATSTPSHAAPPAIQPLKVFTTNTEFA